MTGRTGIGQTRVQQRAAELDSVIGCRSADLIRASSLRAASTGRIDGGNRLPGRNVARSACKAGDVHRCCTEEQEAKEAPSPAADHATRTEFGRSSIWLRT